jgi:hypothetical protein
MTDWYMWGLSAYFTSHPNIFFISEDEMGGQVVCTRQKVEKPFGRLTATLKFVLEG